MQLLDAGLRHSSVVAEFDLTAHVTLVTRRALLMLLEAVVWRNDAAITHGGEWAMPTSMRVAFVAHLDSDLGMNSVNMPFIACARSNDKTLHHATILTFTIKSCAIGNSIEFLDFKGDAA